VKIINLVSVTRKRGRPGSGKFATDLEDRIMFESSKGRNTTEICSLLVDESIDVSTQSVCSILDSNGVELGWPYVMAWNYTQSMRYRVSNIPFDVLVLFFEGYEMSVENNENPSLQDLADYAGLEYASTAQKILDRVGLTNFNEELGERLLFEEQEAIRLAYDLPYLNQTDVAYFVGCTKENVYRYFTNFDKKQGRRRDAETEILQGFGKNKLSYRLASIVYELSDEDSSVNDMAVITDTPLSIVDYALDNRHEGKCLESKLVHALNQMFPKREIKNPYLD
jgi:hypothetical protein